MKFTQNWLGYRDRSFEQIKRSILNRVPTQAPELTDFSESNPLVILISIFAAIGEMLNLYIDALARELYIGTLRRYSSALKIMRQLDYRVKPRVPSTVDLLFTLVDSSTQEPTAYNLGTIYIPTNTQANNSSNQIQFRTAEPNQINPGKVQIYATARQLGPLEVDQPFGVSDGTPLQAIQLPDNYAHNTLTIKVGTDIYKEYDSFGFMIASTKGFIVDALADGNIYAIFGDGVNGLIPPNTVAITGDYYTTSGSDGNLTPSSIDTLVSSISLPAGYSIVVTNPGYAAGGSDIESLEDLRANGPRHIATMRRAVTYKDWGDIAYLTPGVGKVRVSFCCGRYVTLYIGPKTRGLASNLLLQDVKENFEDKRLLQRFPKPLQAGIRRLYFDATIIAAPGVSALDCKAACIEALNNKWGYINSSINLKISESDFIGLIDNLDEVESVILNTLYLEPWARPQNVGQAPLIINFDPITTASIFVDYTLRYNAGTHIFSLYKNNIFVTDLDVSGGPDTYTDSDISFTLEDSINYEDQDQYDFRVYGNYPLIDPYTLQVDDNTIAIFDQDDVALDLQGLPIFYGDLDVSITPISDEYITTC